MMKYNSRTMTPDVQQSRERAFRAAMLAGVATIILLLLHILNSLPSSTSYSTLTSSQHQSLSDCSSRTNSAFPSTTLNETTARLIADRNINLVYFKPPVDVILMTMPKAGTSTLWHWLYPGITGSTSGWDSKKCKSHIHDMNSECWSSHVTYLDKLSVSEQISLLSSSSQKTLRIAIQRDPYDRLISSFKSKFTCEHERYGTDLIDRSELVPILRKRAGLIISTSSKECMNISEFAFVLDQCRQKVGKISSLPSLDVLDVHIAPQKFYFNHIDYHMIIDVTDLSDKNVLKPLVDRLPFKNLMKTVPKHRHQSTGADLELTIPENAAKMLHAFAMLSNPGQLKYLPGAEPQPQPQ